MKVNRKLKPLLKKYAKDKKIDEVIRNLKPDANKFLRSLKRL